MAVPMEGVLQGKLSSAFSILVKEGTRLACVLLLARRHTLTLSSAETRPLFSSLSWPITNMVLFSGYLLLSLERHSVSCLASL